MDISDIKEKHIIKILNSKTLSNLSDRSKFTTKMILNPIFNMAIRESKIIFNPLSSIKFKKSTQKKGLHSRIISNEKEIVSILYNDILELSDIKLKIIMLISLMTARRRGEILKLKWENIYTDKVFASKDSTKTGINDEYPIPVEVIDLLNQLQTEKIGNIFDIHKDTITKKFTKLVKNSSIQLVQDESLTLHDTRHLFMSIMTLETTNADLVDKCISHTKRESIKDTYLSFSYNERKKVFEQYWEILRGKTTLNNETKISKSKITLLKLTEMFNDGMITKEEFLNMKSNL
jgi:integrase